MPVYPFFCKCGNKIDVLSDIETKPDTIKCDLCNNDMYRDFSRQNLNFLLTGTCWERDGYTHDIDDAEDRWLKEGKPVGYWAGTDRGYPKDSSGRVKKLDIRKDKSKVYVPETICA